MKQRQFSAIIGVDLGDKKHNICVTDKDGTILEERVMANTPLQLGKLAAQYPGALVAIEVGAHSPWVSRLLEEHGCRCVVANARKLRAIYTNERKCDQLDARMLAKLARADLELPLARIFHEVSKKESRGCRKSLVLS